MRTTVTLADDVAAEVERLRRQEGVGTSEAVNLLARRGLAKQERGRPGYVHRTAPVGLRVDVVDVAAALELLDEDDA